MPHAPTGLLTLVFTDLQGSTGLWESAPVAMQAALAVHNELMRAQLSAFGGYEVKTEGDSFMIAFQDAATAVEWCMKTQQALLHAPWPDDILGQSTAAPVHSAEGVLLFRGPRVRMGIHSGEPLCQTDPMTGRMDYFGPVVNRAARICDAAHGGQTLVSDSAYQLLDDAVASDLGVHALRGLEEREHLRQLSPPSLISRAFPRLRTLHLHKTNLSDQVDSFFGREDELATLADKLKQKQRLVTILGPGGTGKTRLAQRFGSEQLEMFPGGVWFCDLTDTRSAGGVYGVIASVVGLPLIQGDPEEQLARFFSSRGKALYIFDNFEQIVEEAAGIVGRWLQRSSDAFFLVTSRTRLLVQGEQSFELFPLPIEQGMRLFYDRAHANRPDFLKNQENEPIVRQIVERLDGMSLAIELAAARISVLSPAMILERLSSRFKLLRTNRRDRSKRQSTLRGAIDWSWDLLKQHERTMLATLSIFRGGCTLESVEDIVDLSDFEEDIFVEDVIESLVNQSLLRRVEPLAGHIRFKLLESVRVYAAEKWGEMPQAATTRARRQYMAYFAQFGTPDTLDAMERKGGVLLRNRLRLELDNFYEAMSNALAAQVEDWAAQCAIAANSILATWGPIDAGLRLLEALPTEGLADELDALVSQMRGSALKQLGRVEAAGQVYQQALLVAQAAGAPRLEARIIIGLYQLSCWLGHFERAHTYANHALEIARDLGHEPLEVQALSCLGNLYGSRGEIESALKHHLLAADIARLNCSVAEEAYIRHDLSIIYAQKGLHEEAIKSGHACLSLAERLGDRRLEAAQSGNLAEYYFGLGQFQKALPLLSRGIELGDMIWPMAADVFRGTLALVYGETGRAAEGVALMAVAEPRVRESQHPVELGKLLARRVRVQLRAGQVGGNAELVAEAVAIADRLKVSDDSELRREIIIAQAALASHISGDSSTI